MPTQPIPEGQTVTVVRGPAPTGPCSTLPDAGQWPSQGAGHASPKAGPPDSETVYGVPASTVRKCCGRGCRHCRVYHYRGRAWRPRRYRAPRNDRHWLRRPL